MDSYEVLGNLTVFMVLLVQIVLLLLQTSMLRRYGHRCFLLLLLSSTSGVIYAVLSLLPGFMPLDDSQHLFIFRASSAFVVLGAVLGIWGTVSLFRSYGLLHRAASPNNSFKPKPLRGSA